MTETQLLEQGFYLYKGNKEQALLRLRLGMEVICIIDGMMRSVSIGHSTNAGMIYNIEPLPEIRTIVHQINMIPYINDRYAYYLLIDNEHQLL